MGYVRRLTGAHQHVRPHRVASVMSLLSGNFGQKGPPSGRHSTAPRSGTGQTYAERPCRKRNWIATPSWGPSPSPNRPSNETGATET